MLLPNESLLIDALPFPALIEALRAAFAAGADVPLRHTHHLGAGDSAGISLLMPAWDADGFYGVKIVNIYSNNHKRNKPGLHATYILHDATTGEPLAIFDGNVITSRRTAAASALGVDYLARRNARSLLVCGAGRVGSLLAPAIATVRQLDDIMVWDIDTGASQRTVQALRAQGLPARVAPALEPAARGADIITCATLAGEPFLRAEWLAAGSHVDLVGGFTPRMCEAEPACFAGAGVWVDTAEATQKSGDILNAIAAGCLGSDGIRGDLAALARGRCAARTSSDQRTVFKAVGTALEDLAAAKLAYKQLVRGDTQC
ncbi:ornithine cyclodeaminase [Duganella sp. CF517]|uniref:ornithine cyclodeaminase family protein n=1 Tax=Duganella sp. CF517 TaxID=1881038 RepID=UPI0008AB0AFA|nr:ornithine cyclodeaminase family protein [Duganella sp. CF517]SEN20424.1 ornithine cyclodeaminase [Duganella sp. CF517]